MAMKVLAVYLILVGITAFISIGALSIVIPILALVAGIMILLGR